MFHDDPHLADKIDRIDNTNYGGIDRAVLVPFGHSCAGTADDNHFFVKTGADSIDRDDIAALVFAVEIDRFNDQQLFALQPLVLLRRNDSA